MPGLGSALAIDPQSEAEKIENHIRELADGHCADGIVMGLSGGVDSAVVAALAVHAVGGERVLAYYLYDRDSSRQSGVNAGVVADWLGIKLEREDITPAMRAMGIYSPLVMKITGLSGSINRFLNGMVGPLVYREPLFVSTLRGGALGGRRIKRFFYERTAGLVEAAFNARHIYRRHFLEEKSRENNRLVLGASNRSELMVGWFVKGGVDDLPFSPILGLYKTQVLELAKYLNLPAEIREQSPSADMIKGITDESAMGVSYEIMDVILDCMARGMSDAEILSRGYSEKEIRLVRTINRLSAWKRKVEICSASCG
ncbi:MAG: NAD(+) synthase [Planctomycetota bacterium]|jgi:NAD+ synthase